MNANSIYWMNYSINISREVPKSFLRAGAVLVSEYNELICSAYIGEEYNKSWCSVILSKVRQLQISNAQSIYLTINTVSVSNSFDLVELLKEIHINEIYIGLPDPVLTQYKDDDPVLICNTHVYRYPDELQREILEQNACFFADSKQSLKYTPYFSEYRISNLVVENLKSQGILVSKDEVNSNKLKSKLASLICNRHGIDSSEAVSIVQKAIAEAFNTKYGTYNYSNDARSIDIDWKEYFISLYKKTSTIPLSDNSILNVGVGGGQEAIGLFSNCLCVTFVDIAKAGLKKIKEKMPLSKILVANADDLSKIPDKSYDLYVSLRTYNSSFFDIKKAISEAHRVLKTNATIIVSVANGFLDPERNCIISGLIIPETEFVDIYRGMDAIKQMCTNFLQVGFHNIRIFPTNTEIYLTATTA